MGLLERTVATVMRIMKALTPLVVMGLAFAPVARAEPKCFIDEMTVEGVSRDGRYALTSSTDHFGLVYVFLLDLEDGGVLIDGAVGETEFKAVDADELLRVGRLTLKPMEDGAAWRGPWSKLRKRLQARCGPFELPTRVQEIEVKPRQVSAITIGSKYAILTFHLPEADGCDGTTGEVVAGIPCGPQRDAEVAEDRRILESGTPTQVLATIAKDVYRGRRDPLGAYRLVQQLAASLKPETTAPEVRLAIESDGTLYLSQLGWLGRVHCRSLEAHIESRLGDAWKSPPSPAAARLKQAMLFNLRKCHEPNHDP
jgi:hypothetical protein